MLVVQFTLQFSELDALTQGAQQVQHHTDDEQEDAGVEGEARRDLQRAEQRSLDGPHSTGQHRKSEPRRHDRAGHHQDESYTDHHGRLNPRLAKSRHGTAGHVSQHERQSRDQPRAETAPGPGVAREQQIDRHEQHRGEDDAQAHLQQQGAWPAVLLTFPYKPVLVWPVPGVPPLLSRSGLGALHDVAPSPFDTSCPACVSTPLSSSPGRLRCRWAARMRLAAPMAATAKTVTSPSVSNARKSTMIALTTLVAPASCSARAMYS